MTSEQIIRNILEYFMLGVVGVLLLSAVALFSYFVIYKKILKGKKKVNIKQVLPIILIVGYFIIVIGITMLRGNGYVGSTGNLNLFSSYKEAWNRFSLRGWQFIIINIIMFIPLGILLPTFYKKFRKPIFTIGSGILFTLFIESLQFIFGIGVFDIDDIFNNILGTIIGYGIVMAVLTLRISQEKKLEKVILYLMPLLITVSVFISGGIYYNIKEFGNMPCAYTIQRDLKNTDITLNTEFSDKSESEPIYKAESMNEETATIFAKEFFTNLGLDISNMKIDKDNDSGRYSFTNSNHFMWLHYINSTYSYRNRDYSNSDVKGKSCDNDKLYKILKEYGINVPTEAEIEETDIGRYKIDVDMYKEGNTLIDGTIYCKYYIDDTIKDIRNNVITYQKVKDTYIMSEQEAYEQLKEGKFIAWIRGKSIDKITVIDVKLDYELDTKGFYQPVYI